MIKADTDDPSPEIASAVPYICAVPGNSIDVSDDKLIVIYSRHTLHSVLNVLEFCTPIHYDHYDIYDSE